MLSAPAWTQAQESPESPFRFQGHLWLPGTISAGSGPPSMPVLCAGSLRSNPTNQQAHLTSGPETFFFFFLPSNFPGPGAAKNFGLFDFL